MPNNPHLDIGVQVKYKEILDQMVKDFKQSLTQISNNAKKSEFAVDVEKQIKAISEDIVTMSKSFEKSFEEINSKTINTDNFEKYQQKVSKKFDEMRTSVSGVADQITALKEQIGGLEASDIAEKMKKQFDDYCQSILNTYNELKKVVDITKTVGSIPTNKLNEASAKDYKQTLDYIRRIKKESEELSFDNMDDASLSDNLKKQYDYLQDNIESYKALRKEYAAMYKDDAGYIEKRNELIRYSASIYEAYNALSLLRYEQEDRTGSINADLNKFLNDFDTKYKVSRISSQFEDWEASIEKVLKKSKEASEQIQGTFNTFQIKDGAIHIPIDIATNNSELKEKLSNIVEELGNYTKSNPVIAKVKLVLDKSSSKGYEKNSEIDQQQIDGQNEPALDITKAIQNSYRKAAREAKQIVKTEIEKIQKEFETVPIKLSPDKKAFEDEVSAMVNSSLEKIANETSGINVNEELNKLVANLKEVSTSLSGNESFKFGIDEDSIKRITDAIEGMANMIKRAFGVASDSDIAAQWTVIEDKFKNVAGEEGKLRKANKEHAAAIQELAVEYKKYLDMGGKNDLSTLTKDGRTIRNIREEYQKLNAEVKETQNVLEQKGTGVVLTPDAENFKTDAEKLLDNINLEKEVKLTVSGKSLGDIQDGLDKALTKAEIVQNAINQIPQAEGTGRFIHWTSEQSALAKLSNPNGISTSGQGILSSFTDGLGEAEASSKAILENFDQLHHVFGDKVIVIDIPLDSIRAFNDVTKSPDFIPREYIKGVVDAIDGTVKLNNEQKETISNQEKINNTKSTSSSKDIKDATKANKALATQAEKTSIALENEGKIAQAASERLRELAKEKQAATEANLELGIAAEMTTAALKKEAEAQKEAEKKTTATKKNKRVVDEAVYESNALKWQRDIRQSLLDSGNYEEVYGAQLSRLESGTVKFTANVRTAEGEWKKLTATISSSGDIQSTKLQDLTEKQIAKLEKEIRDAERILAQIAGESVEPITLNKDELESYSKDINKILRDLEKLNNEAKGTYKIDLNSDGKLSITRKEISKTGAETKAFTAIIDNVDEIFEKTADGVVVSAEKLKAALEGAFDSGKVTTSAKDFARTAEDAFNRFEETAKRNSNFSQIEDGLNNLKQSIAGIDSQDALNKFKQDLKDLGVTLNNIKKDANLGSLFEGESRTFSDINEVRANIDSLFASIGKVNEKSIKVKDMKTLIAEVKQANGEIRKFTVTLDSANFARFVDNGISEFTRLEQTSRKILSGIGSFVRIYLSPQDFIRYFRQGFDAVKEIDTAMTELRKVSDATASELAMYFDDAVASAKELGSSVNDMISATADWSRMGYNLPDAKELGELAVLYKNVGDGIDVDEANSSLVSTLQGFQIEAKDAHKIIDSFNEVANNYAINSAGIGEALKRSAAAFNAANTDLNQSIALITAGNEIVQSPEKVGTMWQTVSARIRGTKSELEDLGETTEDVLSTSKLRELVLGYTDVDIMKNANEYKDIYTIVKEIGKEWQNLRDIERAALLEALAGKKQSNTLAAVLNNAERLEEIYQTAESSAGSAMREQEKYTESIQYSIDQLTAHIEEFWAGFIRTEDVKNFVDMLNWVIDKGTQVTSVLGAVPVLIGVIAAVLASTFVAALNATRNELGKVNVQLAITNTLTGYLPVIIGLVAALAVGVISWGIAAADTSKQIEKLTDKIQEQQEAIDELTKKEKDVTDLYKEYNALMSKSQAYGLTASEKESLLKVSQDLVETYGLEVSGIDSVTGAYIIGTNAINQYVEALRQERNEKLREQTDTRNDRIDKNIGSIKKNSAQYDAEQLKKDIGKYVNKNAQNDAKENESKKNYGGTGMGVFGNVNRPSEPKIELPDYVKSIDNPVVQRLIKQSSLTQDDIKELEDALVKDQVKYDSVINSIAKDILTNIQVDNSEYLDSTGESLLTQMLIPYLSSDSVDWDKFNQDEFEQKVKDFAVQAGGTLHYLGEESQKIKEKLNDDKVTLSDYKDYYKNQMEQVSAMRSAFGANSEEAKAFEDQLKKSASSNIGMLFTDISNDMQTSNLDTSKFDKLATSILQLDKAMSEGKIKFSDYVENLNKEVDSVSLEGTFQNNADAANEFFSVLVTKGRSSINNLTAQMQKGTISQKDYVDGLADIASFFTKLGEKATSMPGIAPEVANSIKATSDSVVGLITQIEKYSELIAKMPATWEDFKKSGQSGANALIKGFKDAGITAEDLGYTAGTTIEKIVKDAWDGKADFDKVQDAMKTKFKETLRQMGVAIGNLINELVKKFGDISFSIKTPTNKSGDSPFKALWKWFKGEEELVWGVKLEGEINSEELGNTIAGALGDLNFGSGYTSITNRKPGGNTPPPNNPSDKDKAAFDDNYYSTTKAWLEENKKELESLEKEQDVLNRQFENALETGNKERAEILRGKLAENAKAQKDVLHSQNEAHRITKQNLLESLYLIAPELSGKSWEEISEVDLVNIENSLSKAAEETETSKNNNNKDKAKLKLNTFKGIVEDLKDIDSAIKDNSASWLDVDEKSKNYWVSQIDFQEEYSRNWIENQKAFDNMTEDEELAAYGRMINNNREFQKQILSDTSLSEESKLELIKNTNDKIVAIEKDAYELQKNAFDKANNFANTYLESKKTLLRAHYDVENSIAEARHEINKELETSMTMYGYLEEETRQLLFNQEDYNKLNNELNRIENETLRLQSEYDEKLRNSTAETAEKITSEYQMQYETLMKSYEIAKADLEIAKKKQKLNNALNERNVRMFINGSWQWVANTEDVVNAKAELADAVYAKQVEQAALTQQNSINNLTRQQDDLGVAIKKFENGVIDLKDAVRLAKGAIEDMPNALYSSYSKIGDSSYSSPSSSSSYGGSTGGSSAPSGNTWANIPGIGKVSVHVDSKGNTTNSGLSAGTVVHTNGGDYKIVSAGTEGANYNSSSGYWSIKVKEKNADGTRYTSGGMTLMGEEGFEAYISSNGRLVPINQPTIGNIPSGGVVFNTDQMKNLRTLWDMSNLNLNTDRSYINRQPQQVDQSQDHSIHINGMTVDSGSSDGQALISALRRYVGNH